MPVSVVVRRGALTVIDDDRPPVLVFDLDGTILRVNSFPRWVLFLIGGHIPGVTPRRRAIISLRTLQLIWRRKTGRLSHEALLRGLQRTWRATGSDGHSIAPAVAVRDPAPPDGNFSASLRRHVRSNMTPLLELVASDRADAVLATAAAADYAMTFGRLLGFTHILATPADGAGDEKLNAGEQKRERVQALLDGQGWTGRPLILFTDHIDDLPLMRESRLVCWFGPEHLMADARARAPNASFLLCRALSGATMLAVRQAFTPSAPPVVLGVQVSRARLTTAS